jgi:hypothetical protein
MHWQISSFFLSLLMNKYWKVTEQYFQK